MRSVKPITPFIGVRISWLIVARNSLFARLAACAASLACTSSVSTRLRSLMSRMKALKTASFSSDTAEMDSSTGNSDPSRRSAVISMRCPRTLLCPLCR